MKKDRKESEEKGEEVREKKNLKREGNRKRQKKENNVKDACAIVVGVQCIFLNFFFYY